MVNSRQHLLWILAVLVGIMGLALPLEAADGGGEPTGELAGLLGTAQYRATVFSHHLEGNLLWLVGPEGVLRLEVRRGALHGALAALLNQNGQGWTAVLGGPGQSTINAWGSAWQAPPRGLQRAAQVVTEALAVGPPKALVRCARWRSTPVSQKSRRFQVESLSSDQQERFHGRMSERGLGRGGRDEVLELSWVASPPGGGNWLRVRSTRRPGRLELAPGQAQSVRYAMPEVFVPLWPLGQLLEIIQK